MGKRRYCVTCEGKGELNEDATPLAAVPADKVFIQWAFDTLEAAKFCVRVLTDTMTDEEEEDWDDQTVACNFGTADREDGVGHDEQAQSFEMTSPGAAISIDKSKIKSRVFYVVTYTADGEAARGTVEEAEKADEVTAGTFGPWYSPTGFPEAVNPEARKGCRVDTGEAFAWGDTIAWPAEPKPGVTLDEALKALGALLNAFCKDGEPGEQVDATVDAQTILERAGLRDPEDADEDADE